MAAHSQPVEGKRASKAAAIVDELLREYHPRDFAVELWNGFRWEAEAGQFCQFTWHIRHPALFRALLRPNLQVALAEAFIYGDFDISGDILAIFPIAEYLEKRHFGAAKKLRLAALIASLPSSLHQEKAGAELHGQAHSKSRDRQAVSFHYDVSNDFYQLWLDPAMVYSCAYFKSPDDSLETAQAQKLDYICRKLQLRPGDRLLDIGCGWGGLIIHAVKNYGVRAVGITLSEQQRALTQRRITDAGLSERCEVRLTDYREAGQLGEFDKLVSVGMIEHVGENALPEYFRCAFQLLRPGGVFLNHGIGRAGNRPKPPQRTFTDIYVFPDGDLTPISTTLRCAEQAGFELRDLENLREHYYLTVRHWLKRMESRMEVASELVGELKARIWRLYLAGSAYYFQSGKLDLYQSLLVKCADGRSGLPLTRTDWYS
jgi:cyclopropane-fatty-acyl-phospholipid synthase